ncbi:MAG TPA: SgcJ/EcaC family oxidoreductase [Ktedonobacterales bacterium]
MTPETPEMTSAVKASDESAVRALYQGILASWNARDAAEFAALFTDDAEVIGFDGSQMIGWPEIETTVRQIFADHETGAYVGIIRSVRFLAPAVALLRAVSGVVPAGQSDLNPALNAQQTLIATKHDGAWRITLYQNTPAQFHGRPDLAQRLTDELRAAR